MPGEEPVAVESFGTTADEQAEGESLDDRLAREEPEIGEEATAGEPEQAAGQLSADDPHGDLTAEATGDTVGVAPEESAARLVRVESLEPPPEET